jgi:hypothetical protein
MTKNQDPEHISESLKQFWFKIFKFFDEDPGYAVEEFGSGIRYGMEKFGSGINIPDPQHCF